MPELPEVQTIVSDLQSIVGDKITDFKTYWPKALQNISTKKFSSAIKNRKIKSIERFGKYAIINLEKNLAIVIHLRMTGKLLISTQVASGKDQGLKEKHIRHVFYLRAASRKPKTVLFSDVRKFATISLYDKKDLMNLKNKLGIEPLGKDYTPENFSDAIAKKPHKEIKDVLMDQTVIAGIGNIYASEILFEAKISPHRKVKDLSREEIRSIYKFSMKVLKKAVKLRGTSVSDYRDASGSRGKFQHRLSVYKKHGQQCKKCDTIIEKSTIGQRSAFYCPKCQH